MTDRENWIRAVTFTGPARIPCSMNFAPVMLQRHTAELDRLMRGHPRIFPEYDPATFDFCDEMPVVYRQGERYTDTWGCTWDNIQGGLEGQVIGHPLADWAALATWRPPDPLTHGERGPRDWAEIRKDMEKRKANGLLTHGSAERLFDRLYFLRGFNNLMMDFATEPPDLDRLIAMLTEYELAVIAEWRKIGVDMISFHTDIGTQESTMISPEAFRRHVKPMFRTLFRAVRDAGSLVYLSSDGNITGIVDDLVECGLQAHDPQLRAAGVQRIAKVYRGRLFANVDLDRQGFPFMTPRQIRDQIRSVIDAMYDPRGGFGIFASIYGEVPMRNIEEICACFEEWCF
jgi:uroporphyrinogen decarboxylase